MRRIPYGVACFLLLWAGLSWSGPCHSCLNPTGPAMPAVGFWNERNVSLSTGASADPDIAVGRGFTSAGTIPILIAWSDDTTAPPAVNPERDREIWLAVSMDGGCTFDTYQVTATDVDENTPAVCYNLMHDYANVAYLTQTGVVVVHVEGVSTTPVFSAPEILNLNMLAMDPRNVDITCAPGASTDVYATWNADLSIGPTDFQHIFFKRNKQGGIPGAWEGSSGTSSETILTQLAGFNPSNSTDPAISSDLVSPAAGVSSVNILFVNDNNCDASPSCILFLRSVDGGTTFFGDPIAGLATPLPVSDTDASTAASAPAGFDNDIGSGFTPIWYAGLWLENKGVDTGVFMDAQADSGAAQPQVWNAPPPSDFTVFSSPGVVPHGPALTIFPSGDSPNVRFFSFWEATLPAVGTAEILYHRGLLNLTGPATNKISIPCTNGPFRLTGEYPPRSGGKADSAAADASTSDVFIAFRDDRDGDSEIYFKRSDSRRPAALAGVSAAPLDCPRVGFRVDWTGLTECDIDHYRVLYDKDGGPTWDNFVDVGSPPAVIDGLEMGQTYFFVVYAVDEACNEGPQTPQASVDTPTCEVVLLPGQSNFVDHCSLGLGDRNGNPEPGEQISDVLLSITNPGTLTATNCIGVLSSATPGVTVGAPATSTYPPVSTAPVGNVTPFAFDLDALAFQCGDTIGLSLDVTCDQGVFNVPFSIATAPTPCTPCQATACPAVPPAVALLMAVKSGADVVMSWLPEPLAVSGYNIWYVLVKTDIAIADLLHMDPPGPAEPVPFCAVPDPATAESCTHSGAVSDPSPLFYYQVKGYCVDREGP